MMRHVASNMRQACASSGESTPPEAAGARTLLRGRREDVRPGITRGIVTRGIVRRSFRLLRRFGGDGVHEWHERPQIFPARRRG